jgi:hypothetical protein
MRFHMKTAPRGDAAVPDPTLLLAPTASTNPLPDKATAQPKFSSSGEKYGTLNDVHVPVVHRHVVTYPASKYVCGAPTAKHVPSCDRDTELPKTSPYAGFGDTSMFSSYTMMPWAARRSRVYKHTQRSAAGLAISRRQRIVLKQTHKSARTYPIANQRSRSPTLLQDTLYRCRRIFRASYSLGLRTGGGTAMHTGPKATTA